MSDSYNPRFRVIAAFLAAPLIIPVVLLVVLLPFSGIDHITDSFQGLYGYVVGSLVFWALAALPVAYAIELVLGIPAWMVLKHYRVRSLPAFAGTGALIGFLVYVMFVGLAGNLARDPFANLLNPYLPICVVGASASAILFRAIVFYRQTVENIR